MLTITQELNIDEKGNIKVSSALNEITCHEIDYSASPEKLKFYVKENSSSKLVKELDISANDVIYILNVTEYIDKLYDSLKGIEWRFKFQKSDAIINCAKFILDITNEKITEIVRQDSEYSLRKVIQYESGKEKPIYVRLSDQGFGIYKATLLLLWLSTLRPKLVLIDDFELALHPSLTRAFIKYLLNHLNCQLVIATHSLDVIDTIVDLYRCDGVIGPEDTQVIILKRDEADIVHIRHCDVHEVYVLTSAGHDIRKITELAGL